MTIMKIPRLMLNGFFSVRRFFAFLPIVLLFTSWSCSTKRCAMCDLDNTTIYNVEMNENSSRKYGKKNFITYFAPVPVETVNDKVNVYLVDCEGKDAYKLKHGKELEKFVKENMLIVDSLDVKKITVTSDADIYPVAFTLKKLKDLTNLNLCKRSRNDFKIEARAMFGFRSFKESSYQPLPGDVPMEKELFGFGEGGTMITTGFEAAFLPSIFTVNDKHRFHLGAMTGYWPVDGGHFIPLAIHPRFTFNDITNPLFGNCNALYLFGDLGTAYDVSSEFKKFWSDKLNASFWDLGAGIDFWVTKGMDISLDLGYRRMTLPLSSLEDNPEWAECAESHNIPYSSYPGRRTGQFFIRLGVTF
ncbi:MAG: hypothetical protein KA807_04920 [Prolixibacteraceae bacterium]|nr:hypothetical protein [Prolixibacteraceae bacterium]